MSTTVQQLYTQCCYDLLEPGGLQSGLVTESEFLDLLAIILMDFVSQTGLTWGVFTQPINASQSAYSTTDQMPMVYYVFQNARIVQKIDMFSSLLNGQWMRKAGQTKAYHQDGLPIQTVEIVPPPNWNGTDFTPNVGPPTFGIYGSFQPGMRNLALVGPVIPQQELWGIGDTLSGIPDSATPYLVFGILARIFSKDGEARDPQRALYCNARYSEGISIYKAVVLELTQEAQQEAKAS